MKKQSIYREGSQVLTRLFVGSSRLLVVPLDFAKKEHVAQCCDRDGGYALRKPLRIRNDIQGVDYLLERVSGICRKLHINPERVVFGGEDPGPFAMNFIEEL